MTPHERFLIVWAKDHEEYYVQCMFFDDDQQIRCEGASGYYYPEIKGYVTATKGEILAELGWAIPLSLIRSAALCRQVRSRASCPCQRFWPGTHKMSASPFWFT